MKKSLLLLSALPFAAASVATAAKHLRNTCQAANQARSEQAARSRGHRETEYATEDYISLTPQFEEVEGEAVPAPSEVAKSKVAPKPKAPRKAAVKSTSAESGPKARKPGAVKNTAEGALDVPQAAEASHKAPRKRTPKAPTPMGEGGTEAPSKRAPKKAKTAPDA